MTHFLESRVARKGLSVAFLALTLATVGTACAPATSFSGVEPPSMPHSDPIVPAETGAQTARVLDFEKLSEGLSSAGKFAFDRLTEAAHAAWLRGEGGERIYADTRTLDKFADNDVPLPLNDLVKFSKLSPDHFLAVRVPEVDIELAGQGSKTSSSYNWVIALPESRDPTVAARMAADLRLLSVEDMVKDPTRLAGILQKLGSKGSGVIVRNTFVATPGQLGFDDSVLQKFSLDATYKTYIGQTGLQKAYASSPDPTGMISAGEVVALIRNGNRFPLLQRIPPGGQTLHFLANSPRQLEALSGGDFTQMLARAAEEAAVPVTYPEVAVMLVPVSQGLGDFAVMRTATGELKTFVLNPGYRLLKVGRAGLDFTTRLQYQVDTISQAVATSKVLAEKVDAFSSLEGMSLPEVESGIAARIMLKAQDFMSGGVMAGANAVLIFAPAVNEGLNAQKVQDQVIPALVRSGKLKQEDVDPNHLGVFEALAFAKSYFMPDTENCGQINGGVVSYPLNKIDSPDGMRIKTLKEFKLPDGKKTFRFCDDLPFTIARPTTGDHVSELEFKFDPQVLATGDIKIMAKGKTSELIVIKKSDWNSTFDIKPYEVEHGGGIRIELPDKRVIVVTNNVNDLLFKLQTIETKT